MKKPQISLELRLGEMGKKIKEFEISGNMNEENAILGTFIHTNNHNDDKYNWQYRLDIFHNKYAPDRKDILSESMVDNTLENIFFYNLNINNKLVEPFDFLILRNHDHNDPNEIYSLYILKPKNGN